MNLRSQSFTLIAFASLALAAQQTAISTKDWKTFATKDAKFSLKAPKGWGTTDPEDPARKAADEKIKKNNPRIAAFAENSPKYDLFLVDYGDLGLQTSGSVSLISIKASGLTAATYPQIAQGIIDQAKLEKSGWKEVDLPVGKSVMYWGQLSVVVDEKTKMSVSMIGYVVATDNIVYICTMGTETGQMKAQKPIFEAIAKSIAVK